MGKREAEKRIQNTLLVQKTSTYRRSYCRYKYLAVIITSFVYRSRRRLIIALGMSRSYIVQKQKTIDLDLEMHLLWTLSTSLVIIFIMA